MYEREAEEFKQGLEASPRHNELQYLLGLAYLRLGKEGEAEGEFRKTLETNPHHAEAKKELEKMGGVPLRRKEVVVRPTPIFEGKEWKDVEGKYIDFF